MKEPKGAFEVAGDRKLAEVRDLAPLDYEAWLRMEFEQGFIHLRDRDEKMVELTKLYITTVLGSGSIAIALLGWENLSFRLPLVGMLLMASCVLGEMILLSLAAFRTYFVTCARQINAIRRVYSGSIPQGNIECIVQPTDPAYPPMFHATSAHFMVILLMAFLNATLALLGTLGLTSASSYLGNYRLVFSAVISITFFILNLVYITRKLRKGDSHAE